MIKCGFVVSPVDYQAECQKREEPKGNFVANLGAKQLYKTKSLHETLPVFFISLS
jgi:hypothetical protein